MCAVHRFGSLQCSSHKSQVTSHKSQVTSHKSQVVACSALALAAVALSGCISGKVVDARTKSELAGVQVGAAGFCTGSGCTAGAPTAELSNGLGRWTFDAYGNINGAARVQMVTPGAGSTTVKLTLSKAGYGSTIVHHQSRYEESGGKAFALAQDVYLCPTGERDTDSDGLCDSREGHSRP